MMELSVQELEAAINHWRGLRPAHGDAVTFTPELNLLATMYALMIYRRQACVDLDSLDPGARQLLHAALLQAGHAPPASTP